MIPHPRNRDFLWRDHDRVVPRRLTRAELAAFDRDGFLLVERAFPAVDLKRMTDEIDRLEAGIEDSVLTLESGSRHVYAKDTMTFARNLVARSDLLREIVTGPVFADLGHDLIGPDVRLYFDQAVYKKPGRAKIFPWHQDNGYTFSMPQAYLTLWIALTDATPENGCPQVLPGLHREGTLLHEDSADGLLLAGADDPAVEGRARIVPARAGDIVVFSSLTPHRTGANTGTTVRKAWIVQLMPDGMALVSDDGRRTALDDPATWPPILVGGVPASQPGRFS